MLDERLLNNFRQFARNESGGWLSSSLSVGEFSRAFLCLQNSHRNTHCWRSVQKLETPMSTVPSETTTNVVSKDDALFTQDGNLAVRLHHLSNWSEGLSAQQVQSARTSFWQAGDQWSQERRIERATAEISRGLPYLQTDEGEPLGAGCDRHDA